MSNFAQLKADFSFDNNNNKGSNTFEKSYGAKLNIYIRKNKGLQNFRNKYKLAEHISDREIKKALIDAGLHEEKAVGLILNKSNK